MDCLDLKNINVEDWKVFWNTGKDYRELKKNVILRDNTRICLCSISEFKNLFHGLNSNNYYLDIYIEKKDGLIFKSFNVEEFRSFDSLFEAVLYADLYLKKLGIICLKKVSYNPNWEMMLKPQKS